MDRQFTGSVGFGGYPGYRGFLGYGGMMYGGYPGYLGLCYGHYGGYPFHHTQPSSMGKIKEYVDGLNRILVNYTVGLYGSYNVMAAVNS